MTDNIDELHLKEKGLIAFFRSEYFVLFTFVIIITPFMAHTAHLLLAVSSIQNDYYGYFFAFGFDIAIFAFAINGRMSQATGLALVVFTLNVCFFNLATLGSIVGNEQIVRLFVTVIISGAGSWIIHSYVVFFKEKIGEKREVSKLMIKDAEKDKVIHSLHLKQMDARSEIAHLKGEIDRLTAMTQGKSIEAVEVLNSLENGEIIFPYTCRTCDQTVLTQKSLVGLVKYCKNKNCHRMKDAVNPRDFEIINQKLNGE